MDSILMYDLSWKSVSACAELWKSEFFFPRSTTFKRGNIEIKAEVSNDGLYYESYQNGIVVSTLYINKSGVSDTCRFV